jgi:hypothetical protein
LLTLSALLEMVECWKQSGQPVAALFQHEPKWCCC